MDEVTRFSAVNMAMNGSPDEKRAWLKARLARLGAKGGKARHQAQDDKPFDGQLDGL